MNIGKRALTLATALMLGVTIVGLTADPAAAEKKKPPKKETSETCTLTGSSVDPPTENDYEFYLPGQSEAARKPNGDRTVLECQKDGTWKDLLSEAPVPERPAGTGRVPAQVFEQGSSPSFRQAP